MTPKVGQEAAVDSFAEGLLEKLCYASAFRILLTRQSLPLLICGSNCKAQTDVCVCNEHNILLLVQRLDNDIDPEPQLIAEAIATYQCDNRSRKGDLHLPILEEIIFPAITLFLPSIRSRLLLRLTTLLSLGGTLRRK